MGKYLAPIFMVGEVLMDLLQPKLMSIIVEEGVLGLSSNNVGDLRLVLTTGLKMIGFVVLGGFFGVTSGVFANLCSQNFGNDIRKNAFGRIMSLSFEQTDRFTTGSLITRVTNDITQLQNLVMQCIRGFVRTFMLFAGGIVSLLLIDLSFGVVVACGLPLVVLCAVFFLSKANPKFYILQEKLDRVNNIMQENVSGSRVVKAYVRENHEKDRFKTASGDLVGTPLDILLLFSYMTPIMNLILNISIVAIIKVGSLQVATGGTTPGNVMAAITYISQILNAVMRAAMIFRTVSRGVASGRRVKEVLDCTPAITNGSLSGSSLTGPCASEVVHRQGLSGKTKDPDPGRGHLQRRHQDGKAYSGCHGKADGKPQQPHHCPPPLHHTGRGLHCGHGSGADRRDGQS